MDADFTDLDLRSEVSAVLTVQQSNANALILSPKNAGWKCSIT